MMPDTWDALVTITKQTPAYAWKVGQTIIRRTTRKPGVYRMNPNAGDCGNSEEGIVRVGQSIWRSP